MSYARPSWTAAGGDRALPKRGGSRLRGVEGGGYYHRTLAGIRVAMKPGERRRWTDSPAAGRGRAAGLVKATNRTRSPGGIATWE